MGRKEKANGQAKTKGAAVNLKNSLHAKKKCETNEKTANDTGDAPKGCICPNGCLVG